MHKVTYYTILVNKLYVISYIINFANFYLYFINMNCFYVTTICTNLYNKLYIYNIYVCSITYQQAKSIYSNRFFRFFISIDLNSFGHYLLTFTPCLYSLRVTEQ